MRGGSRRRRTERAWRSRRASRPYFRSLPEEQRPALQKLRDAIDAHRDDLGERVTGKGTISFEYGRPLPVGLVKKVVKTRLAEVAARRR